MGLTWMAEHTHIPSVIFGTVIYDYILAMSMIWGSDTVLESFDDLPLLKRLAHGPYLWKQNNGPLIY